MSSATYRISSTNGNMQRQRRVRLHRQRVTRTGLKFEGRNGQGEAKKRSNSLLVSQEEINPLRKTSSYLVIGVDPRGEERCGHRKAAQNVGDEIHVRVLLVNVVRASDGVRLTRRLTD